MLSEDAQLQRTAIETEHRWKTYVHFDSEQLVVCWLVVDHQKAAVVAVVDIVVQLYGTVFVFCRFFERKILVKRFQIDVLHESEKIRFFVA